MQINFLGTKVNTIFYNDSHGSMTNVDGFLNEQKEYYKKNSKATNLTLCAGDVFITSKPNSEIVAKKLCTQTDAISLGNHDIENGKYLAELIKKFFLKGKMLACNLFFKKENELEKEIYPSIIIEKNGEHFGIIGISPFDFREISGENSNNDFYETLPFYETFKMIQKEVKKLEQQGINKIFLLAHTGEFDKDKNNIYEQLASISGVDVVLGGHDHIQVDKWAKTIAGEPVKIVATGKAKDNDFQENLNIYGILELEFDDDGILIKDKTKCQFKTVAPIKKDSSKTIATIKEPYLKGNVLQGHSEVGNLVADSILWFANLKTKKKADFSIVNPGTIRGSFNSLNVYEEDIQEVVPFPVNLIKTTLTKKQLIETLSWGAQTSTFGKIPLGILQVSNMSYTINPDFSITNVKIFNDDGSIKYDVDNLEDDFEFCVIYDDFLASAPAGLSELKKDIENDESVEKINSTRQQALREYLINGSIKDPKTPRIINLINY